MGAGSATALVQGLRKAAGRIINAFMPTECGLAPAIGEGPTVKRMSDRERGREPIEYMSSINDPELVAFRIRRSEHDDG
jgi:hypothetical protein